jgi:hypothetical protein
MSNFLPPIKKIRSSNFEINKVLDKVVEGYDSIRNFLSATPFVVRTATPASPVQGAANMYIKGDKLVVQYNDNGVVRYKYLTLSGTSGAWTHSTTAP